MATASGRKPARKAARLSADALWEYAVKSLSRRAQSTGELRRKLLLKAEQTADIEPTIARLRDYGYLNDNRFAENYAGARLENQGLGRTRVLRDLRQRKVSSDLAERTVDRVYGETDEMQLIADFIRRKVRTKLPLPEALGDPNTLASAYRKLIRAGFRSSNVLLALKRIAKNHELLDTFEPPEETTPE
jgi:regulatory protein